MEDRDLGSSPVASDPRPNGDARIDPRISAAFEALDAAGVDWALLRGIAELAEPRGDVDVLVAPSAAGSLDEILGSVGFARLQGRGHGTHRFYVSYDTGDDAWIEIDVVTDVAFGRLQEFRSDVTAALLARRQRVASVATLEPGDAFWHLLLHDVLGAGEFPAGHREELRSLVPDAGGDSPLAVLVSRLRSGLVPRLVADVGNGDWEGVHALGLELRRAWRRRHAVDVAIRSTLHSADRHLPVPGSGLDGVSIAILGPDGAGKTTLAEGVRASIPIPARYVYLGIWRQSRFEERLRPIVGARLAVRLVKLLWKSVLIRYHRRLGRVVLLDRYTFDADLPAADVDWKSRISTRLVRRTCPDPDLVILLDGPVELMYARKGEHGVRELQLRRDGYLAMTGQLPQMVVLDAAEPVGDVRRRATALLWEQWSRNVAGGASR